MREQLQALRDRLMKLRQQLDQDNESECYWVSLQVDELADCVMELCRLLAQEDEQRDKAGGGA